MTRRLGLLAAAGAAALASAGCGGSPGDLMSLTVSGGFAPVKQEIVIRGNGQASCNGAPEKDIGSKNLLVAREIERDLGDLADRAATYRAAPGAADFRTYVVRIKKGTVRWDESSRGLPPVLPRAQLLALQLGRDLC